MSGISTHILDTSRGQPAAGVRVSLHFRSAAGWSTIAQGITDTDGRIASLHANPEAGEYRIAFDTEGYFRSRGESAFYPEVVIHVRLDSGKYHLPLLLNPFGYSTYRGS